MKHFPRRLSRRGPGRVSYDPSEPLPPEVPSDEERERALDAKWAVYEQLEKQAAGDCTPDSFVDRWTADLIEGYSPDRDDAGLRSEEREEVMRGE